jgi:hypothetical protein
MFRKHLLTVLGLLMVVSMVLAACGPTPTEAPVATEPAAPAATEVPPTPEPTPVPVRNGAWVDQLVFTGIDQADQAVAQIQSGDIDVYAYTVADAGVFKTVTEDANLTYSTALGSYNELTFNPSGPEFTDGRLNPFSNPKIREAMNMLIDRDNVVQNIYGGLAKVKFLPLNSAFADYVRYVDVAREIEAKYAYNVDKAKAAIDAEMTAMGAVVGADGKWAYKDAPVSVIMIIRTEDARKQIGDYVANQLESIGFVVDRQYKTRSEASPIWNRSNPAEGQWHIYTGGWITTAISRDDGTNFAYFYTPLGSGSPLWQAYTPTDEYFAASEKLWNNEFKSMDERAELFKTAMRGAMEDSVRVWIIDQVSFAPYSAKVQVAYDLAGGIAGSTLYPFTVRRVGEEGGTVKIAQPGILVEPWNPVAGSNWIYDTMPRRATQDYGTIADPYTGLAWPQRIEKAEITVDPSLPITKTLDWVTLNTGAVTPPDDAMVDWDATAQKFLTVADWKAAKEVAGKLDAKAAELSGAATAFDAAAVTQFLTDLAADYAANGGAAVDVAAAIATEDGKAAFEAKVAEIGALATDDEKKAALAAYGTEFVGTDFTYAFAGRDYSTSLTKRVVTYPADFWANAKWHDGSQMTMADFVMGMIMAFDRAKPESAIYDESAVPTYDSFVSVFKGFKFVSTDPLVVEYYSDGYALDAELMATDLWPTYGFGDAPWQTIAMGYQAEAAKELTFSVDKADALKTENDKIEWMSFISGPSLDILKKYADQDAADGFIPYAPTLGQYVTADEAKARYANTVAWFDKQGHFWLGTGPFYLDKVDTTAMSLTLSRNADYTDPADKWAGFGTPMIAEVTVDGAGQVSIGKEAAFDVYVTFQGEAYPADQIDAVKFLLFNAKGELVTVGEGVAADGKYTVTLTADQTSKLEAGSNKIEVAVTSKAVSIPTFATFEFVTVP